MRHLNEYWIAAAGIALAVAFPNLAHSKTASAVPAKSTTVVGAHGLCNTCDPIGDIIVARLEARQSAEAANKAVNTVRFVMAFGGR